MTGWELAREIILSDGMSIDEIEKCFGTSDWDNIFSMNASDAIERYEKFKKDKVRIKTGDVVVNNRKVYCVTAVTDHTLHLIDKNGIVYHIAKKESASFKKLSNFSIKELLTAMKFAEENQDLIIEVDIL